MPIAVGLLAIVALLARCGGEQGPPGKIVLAGGRGILLIPAAGGARSTIAIPDLWFGVAFSPDGKRIAYESDDGIYVTSARGGIGRHVGGQLPTHEFSPIELTWSPNGQRLAFTHGDAIYTIRAEGGGLRFVTRGVTPDWSPDGSEIVFVRPRPPGAVETGRIYTIRPDGTSRRFVTRGAWPRFAPDGRRIAFSRGDRVYVMPRRGGRPRRIARGFNPLWSPDGKYLAFARVTKCFHAVCGGHIFVMRAAGGRARPVGPMIGDIVGALDWAP